jgi:hypothetical protein
MGSIREKTRGQKSRATAPSSSEIVTVWVAQEL